MEPFDGSHLSLPHDDLEFLRDLVGDARVVALGENTHGARDFFEMKARILRFLVEEMGFNTFAIEAAWAEARRLDHYVRTGEGDSAMALSGLYFWTWATESVLEMIEWMREHNEAGGDVGFHGVDMQFAGMPLHLVREFVRFADAANLPMVTEDLDCLSRFANGPAGRTPTPRYDSQPAAALAECGASLESVREHLEGNRERYETAGRVEAFDTALHETGYGKIRAPGPARPVAGFRDSPLIDESADGAAALDAGGHHRLAAGALHDEAEVGEPAEAHRLFHQAGGGLLDPERRSEQRRTRGKPFSETGGLRFGGERFPVGGSESDGRSGRDTEGPVARPPGETVVAEDARRHGASGLG